MSPYDLIALSPEFILAFTGIVLMLLGAFLTERAARWCGTVALAGVLGATAALVYGRRFPGLVFGGMFSVDPFSRYFVILFYVIAALIILASVDYVSRERLPAGEYFALL